MAVPDNPAGPSVGRSQPERVAALMRQQRDVFLGSVADLLDDVAEDHRRGMCGTCEDGGQCSTVTYADRVAFEWLLSELRGRDR